MRRAIKNLKKKKAAGEDKMERRRLRKRMEIGTDSPHFQKKRDEKCKKLQRNHVDGHRISVVCRNFLKQIRVRTYKKRKCWMTHNGNLERREEQQMQCMHALKTELEKEKGSLDNVRGHESGLRQNKQRSNLENVKKGE